jgi:hypoxanthine phosphoribosyltransferase
VHTDLREILYSSEQIQARVSELAAQIEQDYDKKNPIVVCVLKGAFMFMSDLVKHISISMEIDFMSISSYGSATKSSGVVKILKDLDLPVEGRDVIIVEDIIDTGLTLSYLMDVLERRNAKSIKVCALIDKKSRRAVGFEADYVGFSIPDQFIVGYGLDYAEKHRNLPYIGVLKPEVYTK